MILMPIRGPNGEPFGYEPEAKYQIQVLTGKRWVVKSSGKLTIRRLRTFKEEADKADCFRVRKQLPNGVWTGSFAGSDPYAFICAVCRFKGVPL